MAYHGDERRENGVRVPRWALSIIVLVVTELVAFGFGYGRITAIVDSHSDRLERIERKLDTVLQQTR